METTRCSRHRTLNCTCFAVVLSVAFDLVDIDYLFWFAQLGGMKDHPLSEVGRSRTLTLVIPLIFA
jgi:hypothetical protein